MRIPKGYPSVIIGNHPALYDSNGVLLPWTSWQNAIHLEMHWYLRNIFAQR
jgi:hypothetical protein